MKITLLLFTFFIGIQTNLAQTSRLTPCEVKSNNENLKGLIKDYNQLDISNGLTVLVDGEPKEISPALYESIIIKEDEFLSFKLEDGKDVFLKFENTKNNIELLSHNYSKMATNEEAMVEEQMTIDYYLNVNNTLRLLTKENFSAQLTTLFTKAIISKDINYFEIPKVFNEL